MYIKQVRWYIKLTFDGITDVVAVVVVLRTYDLICKCAPVNRMFWLVV